jgi:hypothetical protein
MRRAVQRGSWQRVMDYRVRLPKSGRDSRHARLRRVALTGASVIGVARGHTKRWHTGRVFCLHEMFVRPRLQHRGRGSKLLVAPSASASPDAASYFMSIGCGTPAQVFY